MRLTAATLFASAALTGGLALAAAGTASAAPSDGGQPGVTAAPSGQGDTTPRPQPGVTKERPAPPAPEPEPAPAPAPQTVGQQANWVAPPPKYDNVAPRQMPAPRPQSSPAPAPVQIQDLHMPVPVEPVAPIEAPPARLRLGDYVADRPNWMTETELEKTNNTSAWVEAEVATFWRSVGVDVDRSDRIAAATVAGGAAGAAGGAAVLGVPAAIGGGLIGGTIGGNVGAGAGAVIIPGVGAIPGGVAGTVSGAGIGAAVAGIPAALIGGTVGGIGGAAAGAAFGAGDTSTDPTEIEIPDIEGLDRSDEDTLQATASDWTESAAAELIDNHAPEGQLVVETVQQHMDDRAQAEAVVADQVEVARTVVEEQPGGTEALAVVDAVHDEVDAAMAPLAELTADAVNGIHDGLDSALSD